MIDLQKLQRALEHFFEYVTLVALNISQLCLKCSFRTQKLILDQKLENMIKDHIA